MKTDKILQAIKVLLANNTRENAEKLAKLVGLRLASNVFDINMNAGAGSGVIGRFAVLTGDSENGQQALNDALQLTGLPVDLPVVDSSDLPLDVPMRYSLENHTVEVNSQLLLSRAFMAQAMAEELLHSIDHVGNRQTLSAGSRRMDFLRGDLIFEVQKHYRENGYFAEFFDYPLHIRFSYFKTDRIKAELFARLGVLYFAQPELVKQVLPLAYEVFHGCFGLSRESPVSDLYVRTKIWGNNLGRAAQVHQYHRQVSRNGSSHAASTREQSTDNGLDSLRAALAKALDAPSNGRKARL